MSRSDSFITPSKVIDSLGRFSYLNVFHSFFRIWFGRVHQIRILGISFLSGSLILVCFFTFRPSDYEGLPGHVINLSERAHLNHPVELIDLLHVWLLSWQASPSSEGWPLESLRNEAEADSLYLGSPIRRHRELPIRQIYSDRNVSHEWSPKLTSKRSLMLNVLIYIPSTSQLGRLMVFYTRCIQRRKERSWIEKKTIPIPPFFALFLPFFVSSLPFFCAKISSVND